MGGYPAQETATWQDGRVTYPFNLNASTGDNSTIPLVPPHSFSGEVTVDGQTVASGLEITAIVEGQTIATAHTSSDGRYKLKVPQGTQSFVGKTVTFTVDGEITSQSSIWKQGGVDILNLTVQPRPRPVAEVFSSLIDDGSLVTVWEYDNATQSWSLFDPRPELVWVNDLTEVSRGDILWVEVSSQRVFQGRTLYEGWNLIALR